MQQENEQYYFGQNGVVLSEMDDYQLYEENKDSSAQIVVLSLLGFSTSLLASLVVAQIDLPEPTMDMFQLCILSSGFLILFSAIVAFAIEESSKGRVSFFAIRPEKAPAGVTDFNSILPHRHVTGFGAAVVMALIAFISAAAILGQIQHPNFEIPEIAGLIVIASLCAAFILLIFAPRFTDLSIFNNIMAGLRQMTSGLDPIGRWISWADSILVYLIASAAGAKLKNWKSRYFVLASHILVSSLFAWFADAPYGIFSITWALLVAISTARRWSWIEAERDILLTKAGVDPKSPKIETHEDLRDEALFALLFIIFLLPIGMRQLHFAFGHGMFNIDGEVENNFLSWISFFGVELVKALPFIDWSDIYGAKGVTSINIVNPSAMHTVFAARVIIDFVFIASLLQAISISVSLSKQKRNFLNQIDGTNKLDARIEKSEIAKLAFKDRSGEWKFRPELVNFAHYDGARLSYLRIKSKKGSRLRAAIDQIFKASSRSFEAPGQKLVELSHMRPPNQAKLLELLDTLDLMQEYNLDDLLPAREALNWKGGVANVRHRIVGMITKSDVEPEERAKALSTIMVGINADSLAGIRGMVLNEIGRNKRTAEIAHDSLKALSENDSANSLKKRAKLILTKYDLKSEIRQDAPELAA